VLTTTMPLVMLALWTGVAREAPFRGFTSNDFVAYYLAMLLVRNLTSSWVAWQLGEDIRTGAMSLRLLRPVHPFFALAATHLAAIPLRGLVSLPMIVVLLVSTGGHSLVHDPVQIALVLPSLVASWLITFTFQFAIGSLAFFWTRSNAIMDVYFALFQLLSGYILPLTMMPAWLATAAAWTPFRFMLSAPVELLTRPQDAHGLAVLFGGQLAWLAIIGVVASLVWRAGVRRFEAVGN
jgi:ABC-2 type transport system permease protein